MQTMLRRETKYCKAIKSCLADLGHASNAEILYELRKTYPNLSATTIHRATARLAERGEIKLAPSDLFGSTRYDHNTSNHDHFMCANCGNLYDININRTLLSSVRSQVDDCQINGNVMLTGLCKNCKSKG